MMGYRIEYGFKGKYEEKSSGIHLLIPATGIAFLLFLGLVYCFWPAGTELLRDFFLPGDAAITAAALEHLTQDLQAGQPFTGALENFCRRIIQEAQFAAH